MFFCIGIFEGLQVMSAIWVFAAFSCMPMRQQRVLDVSTLP